MNEFTNNVIQAFSGARRLLKKDSRFKLISLIYGQSGCNLNILYLISMNH